MSDLAIAPVLVPLVVGVVLLLFREGNLRWRRGLGLLSVAVQVLLAMALLDATGDGAILTHALGNWPAPYGIVLVADSAGGLDAADHGPAGPVRPLARLPWAWMPRADTFMSSSSCSCLASTAPSSPAICLTSSSSSRSCCWPPTAWPCMAAAPPGLLANLHYVVINLAGSALFLIAAGLLYGLFGTLNLAHLALLMTQTPEANLGPARTAVLLLFGVFALKAALLPLHLWLPATYGRASAPVAALFAIMTKVGAYAILRVATLMLGDAAPGFTGLYQDWLLPLALVTLMAGMVGALGARRLTDQAAYLVIASVGTLLIAFGLGGREAIAAGLYYLPHSTFAAAALFLLTDRIAQGAGGDWRSLRACAGYPLGPPGRCPLFPVRRAAGGFAARCRALSASSCCCGRPWTIRPGPGSWGSS
jgi:multicomponent K+:H+ antiporter subunit D